MKALRILTVAILALCFFGSAQAQVVVRARIGTPPPPPRHRVVVVHRPVVVHHRVYRHHPYYAHHREVIVRHHRY